MKKVVIVGAGASGLIAAIIATRRGAQVTLIEQGEVLGKKILATGNGKCNYTNEFMTEDCFRGDRGHILSSVLQTFSEKDTIQFFEELGVLPSIKGGYVYPISGQAQTIQEVLVNEILEKQIHVLLGMKVTDIQYGKKTWSVEVCSETEKKKIKGDCVILTCGSRAASHFGSDGSGYTLAKSVGHTIIPVVPALVQLRADKNSMGAILKQWSGVRTHAKVTLMIDGQSIASDVGEVQFTDYGISGIPIFQVSRYAGYGLRENKKVEVVLSLLPDYEKAEVTKLLKERFLKYNPNRTCTQFLTGMLNSKLIPVVLDMAGIEKIKVVANGDMGKKKKRINPVVASKTVGELSVDDVKCLGSVISELVVPISGINDFDQAQICAGGVDTSEITEKMESKLVKGLYFAGEILDVDGICGGYNLQWAWSTGWIAGSEASK